MQHMGAESTEFRWGALLKPCFSAACEASIGHSLRAKRFTAEAMLTFKATLPQILDQPLDRAIQRFGVDRLDQVFQKTGFFALRQVGVRTEAAHRDAA
jgi:hypothetical protein